MPNPVTPEERQRIVDLLQEHGGNQNRVTKMCGRHQKTVGRIAHEEGIESVNAAPQKALAVKKAVEEIDRMEFVVKGLKKGAEMLDGVEDARSYKDVMTGIAIGIDKHRLETGEVTGRTETRQGKGLAGFFEDLDRRAEAEWGSRGGEGT